MTTYAPIGMKAVFTAMEHWQNDTVRENPKLGHYLNTVEYIRGDDTVRSYAGRLILHATGTCNLLGVDNTLRLNVLLALEMAQLSHDQTGILEKLTDNTVWTTVPPSEVFEQYQKFARQTESLYPHQSKIELAEIDRWLHNIEHPLSAESKSRVGYVQPNGYHTGMPTRLIR